MPVSVSLADPSRVPHTPPREPGRVANAPPGESRRAPDARLLVVDDDRNVCLATVLNLRAAGFAVDGAHSGDAALELLGTVRYDLLLCDVRMPGMSGLDLAREALARDAGLAVVMLTGVLDAATATEALRGGALDYVTKPYEHDRLVATVHEALRTRALRAEQHRVERLVREEVALRTSELRLRTAELEQGQAALRAMTVNVAEALITAMEAKDLYLRGHSHRVAALAASLAEELGRPADEVEAIRLAGRLHDVGKIGIREAVLNKPGPLTAEEFAHVQEHVRLGMDILSPLAHLGPVLTYVHHHHEHWDGGGYPQGLAGEAISLGGLILAAADAFDALTSARAYREPLSPDAALAQLAQASGRLLEPGVFEALARVVQRRQALVFLEPS